MRVLIKATPREKELDGITLDRFSPGTIRNVPASIGTWLIAQGYAEPEMRHPPKEELDFSDEVATVGAAVDDRRRHRRSTDR